jgi:hypothetical protein
MKVLVGTILAKDDEKQREWLKLQLCFLKATTDLFDHVTVVWGGIKDTDFPDGTTTVQPEVDFGGYDAHRKGLGYLLHVFRQYQDSYDHFLFLDSDAFPIKKGWVHHLIERMSEYPNFDDEGVVLPTTTGRHFDIAIPVRAENLETRLHSSILFVKKEALPHISFEYAPVPRGDLCGDLEADLHLPEYETDRRHLAYPLMRSNQWNVHPLACGVYYDMFYHHCCGSGRPFNVRGDKYWDKRDLNTPMEEMTQMLMDNPSGFVSRLAGWAPQRYADIEVVPNAEKTG